MPQQKSFPEPHPDCRARHLGDFDYQGPTHACAGPNCRSSEHRATVPEPALDESVASCHVPKEEHRATTPDNNNQHLY